MTCELLISAWVSDVCSSDRFLLDDPAALRLRLLFDQALQRIHIAVVEAVGLEGRGLLLDQRLRQVEQFRIRLRILYVPEIALGAVHLIGVAQRFQHHRSEEHTSELQSLMRISYAVFCLKKKKNK